MVGWEWYIPLAIAALLVPISAADFLLFHVLVELFCVIVAVTVLVVAWNEFLFSRNVFLIFLGCGYFWLGAFDLVHTLLYKGMNIFGPGASAMAVQFRVVARYSEAALLLAAPLTLVRTVSPLRLFGGFGLVFVVSSGLIFSGNFPAAYIEGQGLTPFKIASEYLIIAILALALIHLRRHRTRMRPRILSLVALSIVLAIFAEASFTLYVDLYGSANIIGHFFKVFSYWCIYLAMVNHTVAKRHEELAAAVQHAAIVDSSDDAIISTNLDGTVRSWNRAAEAMYGYLASEIIGRPVTVLAPPDRPREMVEILENVRRGGSVANLETVRRRKDGRPVDVSVTV